ncbi:hypothetical protein M3I53_08400 [Paraburkholderia sp. CNPSo 3272]|uniref:hypothetical protein n=1 Tax=Paraburkholderia sp. CNPSo 3272 TaxID=2940931 RepID=UPI0020B6BB88|nr:hypothetical protein [Paraburkholderia sp. CNPSo 3272]MCP3723151.1 hypothetical protein [Paraburkholderia sp. CNPSo 3272]
MYRSTDLMTQVCTEFSKEIRHRCRTMVSPRAAALATARPRKTTGAAAKSRAQG